eukprot:962865-Alexandrium_andersonii.AAC.1
MSASLVGSEMCIRDRRARLLAPQRRRAPPGRLPARLGARPGGVPTLRTVSYTHLTLPTICSV